LEDGRHLLRVTVKNVGNGEAGASRTTVAFGNDRRTQDTPIIPAGGSVDLLFRVPASCFDPECDFRILVDSEREVGESNEQNNVASGICAD
jgi:subtilase family serine protease